MPISATTLDPADAGRLLEVVTQLSNVRTLEGVIDVVKHAARELVQSDGVTFVLRDEGRCFYVDEVAIAPLWKGQRFPANACVSGWAMIHRESVVIDDVFRDPRVPHDVYRQTFVKSMAMVPIRRADPLGAIGVYWATPRRPTEREVRALELLADAAATTIDNVELYRRLQDTIKLRDEFITVASHELRTPLTPLRLSVEGAMRAVRANAAPEDIAHRLTSAQGHLVRVERLVADLVDNIKMWNGRLVLAPEPLDLAQLTAEVVAEFQARAATHGCSLQLESGGPVAARCDRARLHQALSSLVDNAVKFAAGKPIHVRVERDERDARIIVRDEGRGIAASDHARVFGRFERAVDTNQFGGFGLGLWTAERIVSAHGGRIQLESAPGQGATFTLILPL